MDSEVTVTSVEAATYVIPIDSPDRDVITSMLAGVVMGRSVLDTAGSNEAMCRAASGARASPPPSGGFTTFSDDQTRAQLSGWVDELRIPRVKIKIGESWGTNERRDLQRVELAREAIGDAELYTAGRWPIRND